MYKRNSEGREYKAAAKVHGVFWLEYRVAGQRVREPLIDENNKPITNRQKAETARQVAGGLPSFSGENPPSANGKRAILPPDVIKALQGMTARNWARGRDEILKEYDVQAVNDLK